MRDNYLQLDIKQLYLEIEWQKRVIILSQRASDCDDFFIIQTERLKKELILLINRYLELKSNKKPNKNNRL